MSSEADNTISIDVAARLLMVTGDRVRQLIKSGYIERTGHGKTTLVSAVQGYIKSLKDSHARDMRRNSQADARIREARAKTAELAAAAATREVIPQEDAVLAIEMLVSLFTQELDGLGARVTRDRALRGAIDGEAQEIRARLDRALGKLAGFVAEGGDPPANIGAPSS